MAKRRWICALKGSSTEDRGARSGEASDGPGADHGADEVRRVLLELPGVRSAVVLGIPDPHRGEIVAALVEAEPDSGVDVRAVLETCRARLAPHKVPRRVVVVDRLPLSERGKLQRDEALRLLRGA